MIVGGDWNEETQWIFSAFAGPIEGRILTDLGNWTCRTAARDSTLDFFVVVGPLAEATLGAWVQTDSTVATHRPVVLDLLGCLHEVYV